MTVENKIVIFAYSANNWVLKAQNLFSVTLKEKKKVSSCASLQQVTVCASIGSRVLAYCGFFPEYLTGVPVFVKPVIYCAPGTCITSVQ